jgi:hypothetical protein
LFGREVKWVVFSRRKEKEGVSSDASDGTS